MKYLSVADMAKKWNLSVRSVRNYCAKGRVDFEQTGRQIRDLFKSRIGVTPKITVVPVGTLPRSEKKTQRVIDHREQ